MDNLTEELKEIHDRLTDAQKSFERQVSALDDDVNELHKHIISLGTSNPEQKELLEFIVFINDRLETRHTQFEDILKDIIADILSNKKHTININKKILRHVQNLQPKQNIFLRILSKIKTISDLKTVIGLLFTATLIVMNIFYPDESSEFIKYLISLMFGK